MLSKSHFLFYTCLLFCVGCTSVTYEYYNDGTLHYKRRYKNTKLHGRQYSFYKGKKQLVVSYKNGVPFGKVIEYFENGNIKSKYNRNSNGDKNGICKEYYLSGNIKSKSFFSDVKSYVLKNCNDSNVFNPLKTEGLPINMETKKHKEYYENGKLKMSGHYSNYCYICDDTLKSILVDNTTEIRVTSSVHELKNGNWKYYNEKGILVTKEKWRNGTLLK